MVAHFQDNSIDNINVYGNGESIFHALENDSLMVGMNSILCSSMLITFTDNTLEDISFYTNPDASFIPPHEITAETRQLQGFNWRSVERPTKYQVINHIPYNPPENNDPKIPEKLDFPVRN